MSSLFKRNGKYYVEFYDKHRIQAKKRVGIKVQLLRDAVQIQAEMERMYNLGIYDPWEALGWPLRESKSHTKLSRGTSLGCAVAAFLDSRSGCRKATRDHYRWVLNTLQKDLGKSVQLGKIGSQDILNWLTTNGRSAVSQRTYSKCFQTFVRWLLRSGIEVKSLTAYSLSRPPDTLASKLITLEQMKELTQAAQNSSVSYMADVIEVSFFLALRLSEACALQWEWIDFQSRSLTIQSTEHFTTKTGKATVKPLSAPVMSRLTEISRHCSGVGYVFHNNKGRPLTAKHTSKTFKRLVRQISFSESITFHGLRHGGLSLAIANGANVEAVRMFAGHESLQMTMRYLHLRPNQMHQSITSAFECCNSKS